MHYRLPSNRAKIILQNTTPNIRIKSVSFLILLVDVFESLKLFLMREGFIFCSVLVVGFNTGPLVNLVFAILILLSSPPLPNPLT